MVDAGLVVLAAFVSPYRAERQAIRARLRTGSLSRSLSIPHWMSARAGIPRGCTRRREQGRSAHFTGIDDPYEAPEQAEIHLHNHNIPVAEGVARLLTQLQKSGLIES